MVPAKEKCVHEEEQEELPAYLLTTCLVMLTQHLSPQPKRQPAGLPALQAALLSAKPQHGSCGDKPHSQS